MHLQILSSGSEGNSALVRAGELRLLVDAGLTARGMAARLEAAHVGPRAIDHVLVSHGHLDHARSAGVIGRRHAAWVHAPERILRNRSVVRAPRLAALRIGHPFEVHPLGAGERPLPVPGSEPAVVTPVPLPHDCDPTVAFRVDHGGRRLAVLTDMGNPRRDVALALAGAHVLVLEFNHDPELMETSPYPAVLRRRITGDRGHLSNAQAATMLEWLCGPELHTLVLAHLSQRTNTAERALAAARATLGRLGRDDVRVLVASQHEVGPNLEV